MLLCAVVFVAFTFSYSPGELHKAAVQTAKEEAQSAQRLAIEELMASQAALRAELKELRAERDELWQFVERFVERKELKCSEDADPNTERVCEAYRELQRQREAPR